MTNYIARGRQVVLPLTNKSAGSVAAGDTVILSSGTAAAFTTTTSAGQTDDFVGVVYDATIAQDAIGLVIVQGFVPLITLSSSASLGDYVKTHSVAKQSAPSATRGNGSFGQVLGTGTTPAAFIWGFPDPAAAAGNVATDAIWDAAGDLAVGTGADTAGKLTKGATGTVLTAGASTVAYAFPPGHEFDYVEKTTNTTITATTEGAANTVLTSNAITFDGSTIVMIEHWEYAAVKGSTVIYITLFEDATVLGMTYTSAATVTGPIHMLRRRTPGAGSHTYYAKAHVDGGSGVAGAGAGGSGNGLPCFLRVYKV